MGNCCLEKKKDDEHAEGSSKTAASSSDSEVAAAIAALAEEVVSCSKVPSFDWRFRKGFQSVVIGPKGAQSLVSAMRTAPGGHAVTTLELQCMHIRDVGAVEIATVLKDDVSISSLNLSKCSISDDGLKQLASALNVNSTLQRLLIDGNINGGSGLTSFARMLSSSAVCGLTELHLGLGPNKRLGEDAALALRDVLGRNGPLKIFSLSGEPGSTAKANGGSAAVAPSISVPPLLLNVILEGLTLTTSSIEELYFSSLVSSETGLGSNNSHNRKHLEEQQDEADRMTTRAENSSTHLATAEHQNTTTTSSMMDRGGEVDMFMPMQTLANALSGAHSRLKVLSMKNMRIGDSGASGLASGIANARRLEHLVLRNSGIGDAGLASLAQWGIERNATLRKLELDGLDASGATKGSGGKREARPKPRFSRMAVPQTESAGFPKRRAIRHTEKPEWTWP